MDFLRSLTLLFLASGLFFLCPLETYGEDFDNNDIFGAKALSLIGLEIRDTFLPQLCAKGPVADVSQCLKNNGRTLRANQREGYFAIPGSQLRDGFFSKFEKETLELIDFETELRKTPAGSQLAERIANSRANGNDIAIKVFYNLEQATDQRTRSERAITKSMLHYGFTVSDSKRALIGLNAFQSQTDAFYTLAHEFYHLFDSEIKEEGPTPVDEMYQEIRAILFELRLYAERQIAIPGGKYTDSKFHEAYFVRVDGQNSIDVGKVTYEVFNSAHPNRMPGEYVFETSRGSDILTVSPTGESTFTDIESGNLIRNALVSIFNQHLEKSNTERNGTSIIARLLYYQPKDKIDLTKMKSNVEIIKSMAKGAAVNIILQYGHLLDFTSEIPLKLDGFNKIIDGGPKPRNGGGP